MFKESIPCCYFPTKVILVDDNPEFTENLALALGKNYHCQQFTSPREALIYLKKHAEMVKTLFTKHISQSEHYIPSAVTVDVNVAALCKEIYNQDIRFERPVVLVVDYSMPEMNGLEFCNELVGSPYKKIVLTGEADNDFAVEAFNLGKIDRFLRKGETNYINKLVSYVQELNINYFVQLSQSISDLLSKNENNLLRSQIFIEKFNQIISEYDIVEFYLADDTGSYFLFDEKGNSLAFIVRTEEDMRSFKELAEGDDMHSIADMINSYKKIPDLLTSEDRLLPVKDWKLYNANVLHDNGNVYYYTVIVNIDLNRYTNKKPLSYHQYLYN